MADDDSSIWTNEFFVTSSDLAHTIGNSVAGITYDNIIAISDLTGTPVSCSFSFFLELIVVVGMANYLINDTSAYAATYNYLLEEYLAPTKKGALMELHTSFDPQ